MATYVIPPGAWLSGSDLHPGIGGQGPLHPGIGGHSPLHPGIGGQSPLHPGIGGHSVLQPDSDGSTPTTRLVAAAERLTVAAPWRGEAAEWVYEGSTPALLVAALGRSAARLDRYVDPRRGSTRGDFVSARLDGPAADGPPLWRWGEEPRVLAVLADLNWRFAVSDSTLWYLNKADNEGRNVRFEESIGFYKVPRNEAWMSDQIDKVLRAAIEREDRLPEILSQADDFMAFFCSVVGLYPATAPHTFGLLSLAQRWATPLVMALKNQIAARRPDVASTRIIPVIETPAHGSLPSGHATISALFSRLFGALMYGRYGLDHPRRLALDRLARRIAFNRVVAGVHFPIDSRAGYALGIQMAAHFIGLATTTPQPRRYDFDPATPDQPGLSEHSQPRALDFRPLETSGVAGSEVLGLLWQAACSELRQLGVEGVKP